MQLINPSRASNKNTKEIDTKNASTEAETSSKPFESEEHC